MIEETSAWKYSKFLNSKRTVLIILLIGLLFRVVPYLSNRSLWRDEAAVSINIVHKSYAELIQPLDMDQKAPVGFLWIEKFFTQVFGNNEFALRLFPLLAGLLSVFLFYFLAHRMLHKEVLGLGLFLFIISTTSIYFASEVKQYSSDSTICMALILLAVQQKNKGSSFKNGVLLILIGYVSMLISHPAVFVLASIGTSMIISSLINKNRRMFLFYAVISSFWLLFFITMYMIIYGRVEEGGFFMTYWKNAFMPFPPTSIQDLKWFFVSYQQIFKNPMGYTIGGVAGFLFLSGGFNLWRTNREHFFLLILPAVFALLASGLQKYPFAARLTLFLQPVVTIFIIMGFHFLASANTKNRTMIYFLLSVFIILPMTLKTIKYEVNTERNEVRDVLMQVEEQIEPDDVIIVDIWSSRTFAYYRQRFHLPELSLSFYKETSTVYDEEFEKISSGKRVWVIISGLEKSMSEASFIPKYYKENGILEYEIHSAYAAGYLFSVRQKMPTP